MDRVTKQKDPKRQAAGRKGHEKYMTKLTEDILKMLVVVIVPTIVPMVVSILPTIVPLLLALVVP